MGSLLLLIHGLVFFVQFPHEMGQAIFAAAYELILVAEVQVVPEPLLEMVMVSGWNFPIDQ